MYKMKVAIIHHDFREFGGSEKVVVTLAKYLGADIITFSFNKKLITKHFRTRKSLLKFISIYNPQNTVILVKGSRGMRMEEFANTILSKTKS